MLAFLGGSFLAQREEGDPWVGGLALAMAPALAGSLTSGLTEDGGVGLIAAGLALIGARDLRRGLLAGLLLGLAAACGLVSAWAAAAKGLSRPSGWPIHDRRRPGATRTAPSSTHHQRLRPENAASTSRLNPR